MNFQDDPLSDPEWAYTDDYEATPDDYWEIAMQDCGKHDDKHCDLAGTEYCDFHCPLR